MTTFWCRWEGCVWAESQCWAGSTWSRQYNMDASQQRSICSGTDENQSNLWSTRQLQDLHDPRRDTASCPTFKYSDSSDSSSNTCRWFSEKKSTDVICTDLRVCFFGWTTDCLTDRKYRMTTKMNLHLSSHITENTVFFQYKIIEINAAWG